MLQADGKSMDVDFIWLPEDLGGHSGPPYQGMRTTIRWQRYLAEHMELATDIIWEFVAYDQESGRGAAQCSFPMQGSIPESWLRSGELVEFLSGCRVLAVGKIRGADARIPSDSKL